MLVICVIKILSLETKYLFSRKDEEIKKNVKLGGNHKELITIQDFQLIGN